MAQVCRQLILALTVVAQVLATSACAPSGGSPESGAPAQEDDWLELPPAEMHKTEALLWEGEHPEAQFWSLHSLHIINREVGDALLPGATDVEAFCPRYFEMDVPEQVNFWAYLASAISKYESGFVLGKRKQRAELGIDPVTGRESVSEGLLQASYRDSRRYSFCKFDWEKDKHLASDDPSRTILDPYKNLECGIKILALQVSRMKQIAPKGSSSYWPSLQAGRDTNHIEEIQQLTSSLSFCQ